MGESITDDRATANSATGARLGCSGSQMRNVLMIMLVLAGLPIAGASARGDAATRSTSPPGTGEPWATVNVCDTESHQNQIGIRGSMPGLARRTRMLMRFRVQYKDASAKWRTVKPGADSRWRRVAVGRRGEHDSGWTFEFAPRPTGGAWELRGLVLFQWRRDGRVVRRDRRVTEPGHPGTAGAEPADFSAATCAIA
jgi:hypothetical protein